MTRATLVLLAALLTACDTPDNGVTTDDVGRWLREGCGGDMDCQMMQSWADANCGPNGCAFGPQP